MTYQQIIDYANVVLDDYRMPFYDDTRTVALLNDAIMEFVKQSYDEGELNERRREDLNPLVVKHTFTAVSILDLSAITDFMFTFNMEGVFTDPCNSQSTISRSIRPVKMDRINLILIDSFEKPDDYYPVYTQYNDGTNNVLQVYSTTTPISVSMFYVKLPTTVTTSNLTSSPELGLQTHLEIGKILARKIMEGVDDLNRYPVEQNEIALQRQPTH